MTRRLVFLDAALDDLDGILRSVAQGSGSVAVGLNLATLLRERCARLAGLPGTLGRARPELRAGLRSIAARGYVILFRYGEGSVEVVAILDGRRDIEGLFGDG